MTAISRIVTAEADGEVRIKDPQVRAGQKFLVVYTEDEAASTPEELADQLEALFEETAARMAEVGVTDEDIRIAIEEVRQQSK